MFQCLVNPARAGANHHYHWFNVHFSVPTGIQEHNSHASMGWVAASIYQGIPVVPLELSTTVLEQNSMPDSLADATPVLAGSLAFGASTNLHGSKSYN